MSLENFGYVIPDVLAGMAYPRNGAEAWEELARQGFRSVVALGDPPPEPVPDGMKAFHCELPDFCRIGVAPLHEAVLAIDNSERKVAVFCGGGVGRTGVVLACYLVYLGRSAYQAVAEVRAARPGSIDDDGLEMSVHDYFEFLAHRRRTEGQPHAADVALADRPAGTWAPPDWTPAVRSEPRSPDGEAGARVFLMMRFEQDESLAQIVETAGATLESYGMHPVRADWKQSADMLWSNVRHHMDQSTYGIAVLDRIGAAEVSPNVCLELGYMLAAGKRCLILKERTVELQADLAGHLYKEFDLADTARTVDLGIRSWLLEIGVAKKAGERLVVYVSTGGTCRDPMAKVITEELLRKRGLQLPVRFAALAKGEPSGPGASRGARVAIEELYGADLLADHVTGRLTQAAMEEADLIVVMEQQMIDKALPADKSVVFKELAGLDGDVRDPWSQHDEVLDQEYLQPYRECATELREALEAGLDNILERVGIDPRDQRR